MDQYWLKSWWFLKPGWLVPGLSWCFTGVWLWRIWGYRWWMMNSWWVGGLYQSRLVGSYHNPWMGNPVLNWLLDGLAWSIFNPNLGLILAFLCFFSGVHQRYKILLIMRQASYWWSNLQFSQNWWMILNTIKPWVSLQKTIKAWVNDCLWPLQSQVWC